MNKTWFKNARGGKDARAVKDSPWLYRAGNENREGDTGRPDDTNTRTGPPEGGGNAHPNAGERGGAAHAQSKAEAESANTREV